MSFKMPTPYSAAEDIARQVEDMTKDEDVERSAWPLVIGLVVLVCVILSLFALVPPGIEALAAWIGGEG